MPDSGRIVKLEMHEHHSLAINTQTITPEGVMMDLGNGAMYMEVYFVSQDQESLAPLRPPVGYREDVVYDLANAID